MRSDKFHFDVAFNARDEIQVYLHTFILIRRLRNIRENKNEKVESFKKKVIHG